MRWEDVPFDVACPRCGLDLRGSGDAACARCELELDWAQLVPLDGLRCGCGYALRGLPAPRCPECGKVFDWNEVVDAYRRMRKDVFEYCWRKRPVRSFVRSARLAVRPCRLGRELDIHDPPAVGGVCLLLLAIPAMLVVGVPVLGIVGGAMWSGARWLTTGSFLPLPPWDWGWRWVADYAIGTWAQRNLRGSDVLGAMIAAMPAAAVGTLGGLLLLRQSMRRARVRSDHVLRAFAYVLLQVPSFVLMIWGLNLLLGIVSILADSLAVDRWIQRVAGLQPWVLIVMAGWMVHSLAFAYRRYLRIPHAWPIALAAVTIGVLTGIVFVLMPIVLWNV